MNESEIRIKKMINKVIYIHYLSGRRRIIPVDKILFVDQLDNQILIAFNEDFRITLCVRDGNLYYSIVAGIISGDSHYTEYTLTEAKEND